MVGPSNPEEKGQGGTWRWNPIPGGGGMAQFFPDATPTTSTSTGGAKMTTTSTNPLGISYGSFANTGGTANNTINLQSRVTGSSPGSFAAMPTPPVAPDAPDLGPLQRLQNKAMRQKAIDKAMKEYDELESATRASGFQMADSAGNVYAQRLLQQGVNPVASGVVAAQARLPVYRQLAEIGTEREKTRLDAVARADQMAANIASQIATLQLDYTKTLANFNQQNTAYELDLNKFNASQAARSYEFETNAQLERERLAASLAASGGGGSRRTGGGSGDTRPGFNPGYITNSGPLLPATINGSPIGNGRTVVMGDISNLGM